MQKVSKFKALAILRKIRFLSSLHCLDKSGGLDRLIGFDYFTPPHRLSINLLILKLFLGSVKMVFIRGGRRHLGIAVVAKHLSPQNHQGKIKGEKFFARTDCVNPTRIVEWL